ncbi:MAG: NAD-dependent DNA ligase LigA [Patescibacteria group bacterium]
MTKNKAKVRIAKLRAEINHHRYLYHVLDQQEISDAALDSLKHELYKLEQAYPDLITADSPTQRVAGEPLAEFKKVRHSRSVISIEDAFSLEEIKDWQDRNEKLLEQKITGYYGELKMDGLAIVLTYEQGLLVRGATRGNGLVGEEVTSNLRTIESIPLRLEKIKQHLPSRLEVRGEMVIYKKELERINRLQQGRGLPEFANPRNLAAGSIRQLDSKIASERAMIFYAFEILTDIGQTTHQQVHSLLKQLGFKINPNCRLLTNLLAAARYIKEWENKRQKLPYQTDGAVLVVNNINQQRLLGSIGKTERWMIAYKFPAEQATTRVKDIVVQVGRTGTLTPVVVLESVKLAGTTVSRATLHNEDEIKRLDVRVGDTVIVQKAGDIIPDIVQVLPKLRTGQEKIFTMPRHCPVCGGSVSRKPGEVAWYCTNKNCFAILSERLHYFVGKKSFDIDGLGPRILDLLLEQGLIKDAADLFTLKAGDLQPLERFAEKSAQNLINAIAQAKKISFSRFINSLGIRHVGEETAIELAAYFGSVARLQQVSLQELENIKDIGPVVAKSIYDFFNNSTNQKFIKRLQDLGIDIKTAAVVRQGKLADQIVVVTGSLENFTREEAKQAIRQAGGKVSESVSRETDLVVVGEDSGSKADKAKKLGVKIINENEFSKLVS